MQIGTRSVLFGAHQFLIHPLFVLWACRRLYGTALHVQVVTAAFCHDLGYWGKDGLDTPDGERHVEFGARLMALLFDSRRIEVGSVVRTRTGEMVVVEHPEQAARLSAQAGAVVFNTWGQYSLLHSRFYAKRLGLPVSQLCAADKLSLNEPWWLYLPRVIASGEVWEFLFNATQPSKYSGDANTPDMPIDITRAEINARRLTPRTFRAMRQWHARLRVYMTAWVEEHRDGRLDTWTLAVPVTTGEAPCPPRSTD